MRSLICHILATVAGRPVAAAGAVRPPPALSAFPRQQPNAARSSAGSWTESAYCLYGRGPGTSGFLDDRRRGPCGERSVRGVAQGIVYQIRSVTDRPIRSWSTPIYLWRSDTAGQPGVREARGRFVAHGRRCVPRASRVSRDGARRLPREEAPHPGGRVDSFKDAVDPYGSPSRRTCGCFAFF